MIKITVFTHDAGPTENIINVITQFKEQYDWNVLVYEHSPAHKLCEKGCIPVIFINTETNLKKLLIQLKPTLLYLATSWQHQVHLSFIHLARALEIPSLVSMDHWVNYRERFNFPKTGWQNNLPDFISVHDTHAYDLAKNFGFHNILPLKFYTLLNDFEALNFESIQSTNQLLFISEPTLQVAKTTYNNERYWGFSEFEIIEELCSNISVFKTNQLKIRLHPSDEPSKYNYLLEQYPNIHIVIENSYEQALLPSIMKSKVVIGVDGVVLYKAKVLGKKAISYIPQIKDPQRICTVPLFQENLIHTIDSNLTLDNFKAENTITAVKNFGWSFDEVVHHILKKQKLKTAIVGCGNIGGEYDTPNSTYILTHAHAYLKHVNTDLVACCDLDKKRLEHFQTKWDPAIRTYTNIKDLLNNEHLDMVSICTTTASHFEILSLLLKYNIPYILCEKPFVSTLKEYEEVVLLLQNSTSKIIINYMRCFDPSVLKLKKLIESKRLGRICSFNAQINKGLIHNGSHVLSLIEILVGEITSINVASCHKINDDFIGHFHIHTHTTSGTLNTLGDILYSIFFTAIYFEKGYVMIDDLGFKIQIYETRPSNIFHGTSTLHFKKKLPNTLQYYALNTLNFFLKNNTTDIVLKHLAFSKKMLLLKEKLDTNTKEVYFEEM